MSSGYKWTYRENQPCLYEYKVGNRGVICLRFGCSPACVTCKYSRTQNTPACYEALPGFPEDCISKYFIEECKKFCKFANHDSDY
ncbi:hypothetical protein [Desulfolucanica intricata]|uniref:hypothetical protein n=1 Tax=Desulfolucanica intricata TaxID=1285191 RepID=UPI0008320F5E|nr:hypothetical protein [Desulfolucanica intricata]